MRARLPPGINAMQAVCMVWVAIICVATLGKRGWERLLSFCGKAMERPEPNFQSMLVFVWPGDSETGHDQLFVESAVPSECRKALLLQPEGGWVTILCTAGLAAGVFEFSQDVVNREKEGSHVP